MVFHQHDVLADFLNVGLVGLGVMGQGLIHLPFDPDIFNHQPLFLVLELTD